MAVQDQYKIVSNVIRIAISPDLSPQEKLKEIAFSAAQALRAASATFFLAAPDGRTLDEKVSTLLPDYRQHCKIPFGKGIAGKCAAGAKPCRRGVGSLHADEPFIGNERQVAAFPILERDQLLGVASFGLLRDTPLDDSEQNLLEVMLLQAAGIIRCKRQFEDTTRKLRELSFLHRIGSAMLSTIQLNRLIDLLLAGLTTGPAPLFDRAMLFLANERAGMLQGMMGKTVADLPPQEFDLAAADYPVAHEQDPAAETEFCRLVKATRIPLDPTHNLISAAIVDRELCTVRNPRRERPLDRTFSRRFGSTPYAVSPLVANNQAIGAIVVDNRLSARPLQDEDLRLLQLLTAQAGMAAENSMLYNQLEEANRTLRDTQDQLLQGEKLAAIGRMAAGIAHEVRNPLVSVGGFANRLKRRFPADSEEWQYADVIVREVQHLENLLTDILYFAKRPTICYGRCSIVQIVEDALSVVSLTLEEKNIRVERRFSSRLPLVLGDCLQLRHVFMNLFCNAHEAMGQGGCLTIEIAAAQLDSKRAVSVKVSDTGGGIPPEVLHTIFTPFFTTKDMGTGLGLPIVHKIVTSHGGTIDVVNRSGSGAEFTVILPVSP